MSLDAKNKTGLCEWVYLLDTYKHIAFNVRADRPRSDGYFTPIQDRAHGYRHVVICEPHPCQLENWNVEFLKQYDSCVTYNKSFIEKHKHELNLHLMYGHPAANNYYVLDSHLSYEEKIKGVCFINRGYPLRVKVLNELNVEPYLVKHVFSKEPWGDVHYRGFQGGGIPSSCDTLALINKYLFRVCFEYTYDPFYANGFVTERITDCFKAKTIPIYLGCSNIEEFVPRELFVDYRDFNFDNAALSDYLLSFPKSKYIDMVDAAYEWVKTCRIGNIDDLEVILRGLK